MADRYRYALTIQERPTDEVVTLAQARANCSIDATDDTHDDMLELLIAQASQYVQERTNVTLLPTEYAMTFDMFPCKRKSLELPRWPVRSIEAIEYIDAAGNTQEIAAERIVLRKDDQGRARVALRNWCDWPITAVTPDAVVVRFVAGWTTPSDVPPLWTRAILMLIAWWFEQREAGIVGTISGTAPLGIDAILEAAATADAFEEFEL